LLWRRVHKCPRLTPDQRIDRYNFSTGNLNKDFENTCFVDETSVWENECPKYAYRPMGSYPDSVEISSGSSKKLNLLCGISCRGATNYVVNYLFKKFIKKFK
jgi:hypothetical protein